MLSYSILFVTFVMFSGLISGFSSVNQLGIRSDSISQSKTEYLSTSSNKTPLSRYDKRSLFRKKTPQPGVKCDGTFYKQTRVEAVAQRACRDAVLLGNIRTTRNRLSHMYKLPRYDFPAPHLFPQETGKLTMIRIVGEFFSFQNLRAFLRIGKVDYVVFSGACKSVGVVRQTSRNNFVLCKAVHNGNPEYAAVY